MNTEEYHLNILITLLEDFFPEHAVWVLGKNSINELNLTSRLELSVIGKQEVKSDVMELAVKAFKESDLPFEVIISHHDVLDYQTNSKIDYDLLKA